MRAHLSILLIPFIFLCESCKTRNKAINKNVDLNTAEARIQPNVWQSIGPFGSPTPMAPKGEWSAHGTGRFESINIHPDNPNEILIGHATSGLFKTIDGGKNWQQKLNFEFATGIFDIIRFKKNKSHLIACCATDMGADKQFGYGLVESFDNGETWQRNSLQYDPTEYNCRLQRGIAITDKKNEQRLITISDHDIHISTDGAKSWNKVFTTKENLRSIKVNPDNDKNIIVTGNVLLVTNDGGETWSNETDRICKTYGSVAGLYARFEVAFSQKNKQKLFIAVSHNSSYLLHSNAALSDIKLISKSQFTANLYHMCLGTFYDDKSGLESLLIGTTRLFSSDNDGVSFLQRTSPEQGVNYQAHDDVNALSVQSGIIFMTTDGGANYSTDAGLTWNSLTNYSANLNASLIFGFDKAKNETIMAGTQDKGIFVYKKRKWSSCDIYGDGGRVAVMADSLAFACGYAKNCYVTKDEGKTFTYNHAGEDVNFFDFRLQYSLSTKTLFLANLHLYKQTEGRNFEILTSALSNERPIGAFWVNNENNDEIWLSRMDATWGAPLKNKLFYTNDGGQNWQDRTEAMPILKWRAISDIDVNQNGDIAITLSGFDNEKSDVLNKVFISKDGGNTFENISAGLSNVPVTSIEPVGNDWVCGNVNGIFIKQGDAAWQKLSDGFPQTIVTEIKYYEEQRMLYVSTLGRGLWRIWLN